MELVVTGAIGRVLPKLGELLKEEYGLQKGVREKIKSLSRELEVVHTILRKIGDVPSDQLDELVSLWVRDVREASYDMEDIVDIFLVRVEDHKPTDPNMLRRLRKKIGGLLKKSKARRNISSMIQDINEKLEEVAARHGRYTLDSIVTKPVAATTIDPRILSLYKRATELVGIDRPRDELINMLSLGGNVDVLDKNMKVTSIVGFGGLGKTTLAKAVYDQLKPHFERTAFVPVGQNPDMKKVFRDILIGLDKEKYTNSDLMILDEKQLMDELEELLEQKRYFIVVDDIWDKTSWNLIRGALQNSNCGSRVVITTRISEVAAHAGESYKMQPLSHENSEKLLYARLADGEGKYFVRSSAEACDKILKKCGGVPLAIITIASLLASKPGEDWSAVYNSIGFGHGGNDDVDNTRKILSFSYYNLPSHLKACLLYLSVFLEDQVIEKNGLIWMWIAEGFIHEEQTEGVGSYELGERCFNELINRTMIQPVETDDEGYVYGCRVHDMVFDLIRSLSSQENFVTVLDGDERQKLPRSIARRLALQRIKEHNSVQLDNIAVDKVRSFIASQCNLGSSCRRIIPGLRVLEMVYCRQGMPDYLGSLLHLRYLRLAYTGITVLPREVRYLRFLQTLDLWQSDDIKELPEDVGLLTQLVHLRLSWYTRVPAGLIGKLTALQELWIGPAAAAADDDDDDDDAVTMQFVKELGKLRVLRVLDTYIDVKSESVERALLESLNLHNIRSLDIGGSSLDNKSGTSHAQDCFPVGISIQYLRLKCFVFSELAACIKSSLAPNLSYLEVEVLVVKEQDMETLARLPELSCLKLHSHDETKLISIKIRTEGAGHFRKLRILHIFGSTIWFDLQGGRCNSGSVASAAMPCLESLEFQLGVRFIQDAALLLSFDRLLGFENLGGTSLQRVTAYVHCGGARISEVEEVEAALERTAAIHPKPPTLQMIRLAQDDMLSPYQQKGKGKGKTNPPSGNKHCTKCGSDCHVAKDCRIPKHLVLLYQKSLKEAN